MGGESSEIVYTHEMNDMDVDKGMDMDMDMDMDKRSKEYRSVQLNDMDMDKKSKEYQSVQLDESYDEELTPAENVETKLGWFNRIIAGCAETKGIEPITDEEKTDTSLINAASMWFTANMVLPTFSLGCLGPMVFDLNFGVSVLTICFFSVLGLLSVAFFSVFGAELGLRQMVLSRFLIGNWAARAFSVINTVACVGWGIVNTVSAAQLLNLVNQPHNMPLWAGCVVIVGSTVLVTFFGYKVIHLYQKYSWVPNFGVFLVIIARLKMSHTFTNGPWGGGPTTAGNVLSFGLSIYGFAAGWTTYAADYTVYMPRSTNKYKIFFWLCAGLAFPLFFCLILGAACARGALEKKSWQALYNTNSGGGIAYSVMVPDSLHGFGQFCCVVLAMSTVANNVPNMYTVALSVQAVWEPFAKVPRVVWTLLANAFTVAIACAAAYKFETFMNYFMDSIGYYISIYIAMAISEHFIYRRGRFSAYHVEDWNNAKKLPVGLVGCVALFCSCFGVAVGMAQTYWVGEAARQIGEYGGDIGFELGFGIAFVVYNIGRPLELKYFGR
ncbi:FCY22 (YER060W-A) [Zygosaccharomyces parabailii]|nr:FCY22 (YER060W-A) [Zygosaccharomyces parabailii]CDH08356.1 probable Purine-cytosine permease FCY21 [Zygosaccharomyces bailii ISA1307]